MKGRSGIFGTQSINPSLYPKMPYDSLKDFALISLVATQALVAVVSAKSVYGSLGALITAAKAKPGTVTVAHTGNGTVGQEDYDLWRSTFGTATGLPAADGASGAGATGRRAGWASRSAR